MLFDVDVMGGMNIKNQFGEQALAIFIMPPSVEVLKQRLEERGTESAEKIQHRVNKASLELRFARKFDVSIMNDDLATALKETERLVTDFLLNPEK